MIEYKPGDIVKCISAEWQPYESSYIINQYPIIGQLYTVRWYALPDGVVITNRGGVVRHPSIGIVGIFFLKQPPNCNYIPMFDVYAFTLVKTPSIDTLKKILC